LHSRTTPYESALSDSILSQAGEIEKDPEGPVVVRFGLRVRPVKREILRYA